MQQNRSIIGLVFILMNLSSYQALCLDNHYWSNQFGPRSALMSGAVVGGVRDNSAGFYNPGAFGFVQEPSFSINADAYQLQRLTIADGAGTSDDLESQQVNVIPLLLSGSFPLGGQTFGYSILTKESSSVNLSARNEKTVDVLQSNPLFGAAFDGPEQYRGQYLYNSKISEYWAGLSWANRLNKNLSMGISGFLALRQQNNDTTALARATNQHVQHNSVNFMVGIQDFVRHIDFYNVRGLLKLGIAADLKPVKFGATLTTPSVNLLGNGTSSLSLSTTKSDELFLDPNSKIPYNTILDDRQENLDAEYKTPLSLAIGLEYALNQHTRLAGTVEWFAKQDRYEVMMPASRELLVGKPPQLAEQIVFDSQPYLKVVESADDVVNFAVAVEQTFDEQYQGYLSFRTDFSTFNQTRGISNIPSHWDVYHTTVGFRRKSKSNKSEWAFGLTYSFGRQEQLERPVNLNPLSTQRTETDFLLPTAYSETDAKYNALSFIIGYTYSLQ